MDLSFEPFVGLGSLKFGMSEAEVGAYLESVDFEINCDFQKGRLVALFVYPDDIESLIISGEDVIKMDRLAAALYLAQRSSDYGQAQGGSLYFMDMGCAILQFETPIREFFFFARDYDTGEPLMKMTPDLIESYYNETV